MANEKIYFGKVKEHRVWYFVEYAPPLEGYRFATLDLVILENPINKAKIAETMEIELHKWLLRFPVPLMVFAYDDTESLIHIEPIRNCNYLTGFIPKGQTTPKALWKSVEHEDLPDNGLDRDYLKSLYTGFPSRTQADIDLECQKQKRAVQTLRGLIFLGTIIVPSVMLILPEISRWVAWTVLGYGVVGILIKILKFFGKWPKSKRQIAKEKEDLEKEHHHYHCKKNPEGFLRLKSENFKRETQERTHKEASSIASKGNTSAPDQSIKLAVECKNAGEMTW